MSVLIPIKMPTNCCGCPCYDFDYGRCQIVERDPRYPSLEKLDCCPLVEVSDDTLIQQLEYLSNVQLKLKELVKYVSDNNLIISEVDKG